jgi:hypothetical protein
VERDLAGRRVAPVLEQIDALPRAKRQPGRRDRDRQLRLGKRSPKVYSAEFSGAMRAKQVSRSRRAVLAAFSWIRSEADV